MRNFALAILSALVTASASAQTVITSVVHNGHTYSLLSNSNWTDAEAKAITLGGHLATINDASEDAWVFSTFSTYGGINRDLWIGLNDAKKEGTFVWSSGNASTYRHWSGGQPDNSNRNESYVHIQSNSFPGFHGYWNDLANSTSTAFSPLYGVVEVEAVPEPATVAALTVGLAALVRRHRTNK